MTPTQQHIIEKMRKHQIDSGCKLNEIFMCIPFGYYEECPSWLCIYPDGKEIVYSINRAGYNVY